MTDSDEWRTQSAGAPSIGAGLQWAWARFPANTGVVVGAATAWIAIVIVSFNALFGVVLLTYVIAVSAAHESPGAQLAIVAVFATVVLLVVAVIVSCWLNGLVKIADGHRAVFGDFFQVRGLKPIWAILVGAGLVCALAVAAFAVGLHLPWLAGLMCFLTGLLMMWIVYAAADLRAGIAAAMSMGIRLTVANLRPTFVVYLTSVLLTLADILLLIVGALVTAPLSGLLMLYYFRSLTRRPIVAG